MNVGSKGVPYPHIKPAAKAVEKVKTRINEITARNQTWRPMDEVVRDMNRTLRGWSGYFHFKNSSAVFLKVKRHTEERLRNHLRKRHKIVNWKSAMTQFPRRALYEKHGLYKLPTVAGRRRMPWREEHRKAVCGNWGWQGFCEAKTRKTARTV